MEVLASCLLSGSHLMGSDACPWASRGLARKSATLIVPDARPWARRLGIPGGFPTGFPFPG